MSNEQTKITILPSEQVVEDSNKTYVVTDSKGRAITLKRPGILEQFDLVAVLGEDAKNDVYRIMCIPILYVAAIDGDSVMTISSNREMRALIKLLDESGFKAVQAGIQKYFNSVVEGGDEEAIKK